MFRPLSKPAKIHPLDIVYTVNRRPASSSLTANAPRAKRANKPEIEPVYLTPGRPWYLYTMTIINPDSPGSLTPDKHDVFFREGAKFVAEHILSPDIREGLQWYYPWADFVFRRFGGPSAALFIKLGIYTDVELSDSELNRLISWKDGDVNLEGMYDAGAILRFWYMDLAEDNVFKRCEPLFALASVLTYLQIRFHREIGRCTRFDFSVESIGERPPPVLRPLSQIMLEETYGITPV